MARRAWHAARLAKLLAVEHARPPDGLAFETVPSFAEARAIALEKGEIEEPENDDEASRTACTSTRKSRICAQLHGDHGRVVCKHMGS